MILLVITTGFILTLNINFGKSQLFFGDVPRSTCKNVTVLPRKMAADVRGDSPYYVVAVSSTPRTRQLDNICYSYFDAGQDTFIHVVSMVFKNGSTLQEIVLKRDTTIPGITEARGDNCGYRDHTQPLICDYTVVPIYRCFLLGECPRTEARYPGLDIRLMIAANPAVSAKCRMEIEQTMAQTTDNFYKSEYLMLPQNLPYQCATRLDSFNPHKALGTLTTSAVENSQHSFIKSGGKEKIKGFKVIVRRYRTPIVASLKKRAYKRGASITMK